MTTASLSARQPNFGDRSDQEATVAIVGDLHLEPDQMRLFHKARRQINDVLSDEISSKPLPSAGVVQLGDLGGYNHQPGSHKCFLTAKEYLDGFKVPYAVITGNHDLEGNDFETDDDNLAAWSKVFDQRHYWALDAGPLLCIGLSTVRFRSNNFSAHEVHIDGEQMAWFEQQLQQAGNRPVAVFTHAPIMGSGIKAVLNVHVKNRCAWVNQSSDPKALMRLVHTYPCIKLWFSGHYHLSHDYGDSIALVGSCAFVNTGVIGNGTRDGCRHSRILAVNGEGYELSTYDHEEGAQRCDLRRQWTESAPVASAPSTTAAANSPDNEQAVQDIERQASSLQACTAAKEIGSHSRSGSSPSGQAALQWYDIGRGRLLARYPGLLCEFDAELRAPMGAVFVNMEPEDTLSFLDSDGNELNVPSSSSSSNGVANSRALDCRAADTIALHSSLPANSRRAQRNSEGGFYQIFQPNKWRLRKEREAQAAAHAR
ncbi:hypothetical protein WJX73_008858 [Symbiochloris irregularis]|uniref:Calcineurin-like phosphoesterase domain-containing protein n=1 Tax=Symbiochloris irregularis TaxID=706552 RepID=A0AAW1P1V4_9CHLO